MAGMHSFDALAFGAHPDDVELTCAGTLIKLVRLGYRVAVVSLSRGELGTRGTPEIRREEFGEAAGLMGVAAHDILELPDGRLGPSPDQVEQVIRAIRSYRPRLIFAPFWEDRHPDHARASLLISEAAFMAGLPRVDSGQEAWRPNRVLFYPSRYEFKPSFIVDVTDTHDLKMKAVQAYRSQFHHDEMSRFGSQQTNISTPGFLEAVVARGRQYGSYIGVSFGEPFLAREPLRIDDPVQFFGPDYLRSFV